MATVQKQTKNISSARPRSYSDLYKNSKNVVAAANPAEEASSEARPAATKRTTTVDWQGEYGYVLGDLRRLVTVTGVLVIAMVIASFFI